MMKTGKDSRNITSARAVRDGQRRAEMLTLRLEGLTLEQIGDRMGVGKPTVSRVISNALAAHTREPAEELRALELARLDSLYAEALKAVRSFTPVLHNGRIVQIPVINSNGDTVNHPETGQPLTCIAQDRQPVLAGIACAVRIGERRAKLLGLDAPVRGMQEVTISGNGQPDITHLSVEDLEGIKQKLYGGQRLLASTPAEGEAA
jgi:transcriptional regulator with XRE-family HTH domain